MKIIKNRVVHLFDKLHSTLNVHEFAQLIADLRKTNFVKSVTNLKAILTKFHFDLTPQHIKDLYDAVPSKYDEAGIQSLNMGRFVNLERILKAGQGLQGLDDLLELEAENQKARDEAAIQGFERGNEDHLVMLAISNPLVWGDMWR